MKLEHIHNVFFIGIGGIGMSALARYFKFLGIQVNGYDRTETSLTKKLVEEGIEIHYEDRIDYIPEKILNSPHKESLIIYTPAIPGSHNQWNYFKEKGFKIYKRSEILGLVSKDKKGIAVAGTHGKTTVSTQIAHILKHSHLDCNAFLGGISNNYETNFIFSESSEYMVLEADEYDRSFLQLNPHIAVITSVEPDHLDIYGGFSTLKRNFELFTDLVDDDGILLIRKGTRIDVETKALQQKYYYSTTEYADFFAKNIRLENYRYIIDLVTPGAIIPDLEIGFPGYINVENTIAAAAVAYLSGASVSEIKEAVKSFSGVKRRFDHKIFDDKIIYIDDYAHHPSELKACLNSIRKLYLDKKVTGIFQPHLYSRTKDFADAFAQSLEILDRIILTDLYPAREEKIEGVSSEIIFNKIQNKNKVLIPKENIIDQLKDDESNVIVTLGAGDIDKEVEKIKSFLIEKYKVNQ